MEFALTAGRTGRADDSYGSVRNAIVGGLWGAR